MSNPYGGTPYGNPDDQNPYGGGQGGQPPYGAPYGGGGGYGGPPPAKTDGVSIAALVLSFLCCLAPVGVILGFVGLSRTKNGQRKGRGLAIAAIVIGIVVTLVVIALVAFGVVFGKSVVSPGEAEVGQCVNLDNDDNTVLMREAECDGDHDAEIVGVAEVTSDNIDAVKDQMAGYCATAIDSDDLATLSDYLDKIKAVTEDPDNVSEGDHLVCYVEADGLTEPLL